MYLLYLKKTLSDPVLCYLIWKAALCQTYIYSAPKVDVCSSSTNRETGAQAAMHRSGQDRAQARGSCVMLPFFSSHEDIHWTQHREESISLEEMARAREFSINKGSKVWNYCGSPCKFTATIFSLLQRSHHSCSSFYRHHTVASWRKHSKKPNNHPTNYMQMEEKGSHKDIEQQECRKSCQVLFEKPFWHRLEDTAHPCKPSKTPVSTNPTTKRQTSHTTFNSGDYFCAWDHLMCQQDLSSAPPCHQPNSNTQGSFDLPHTSQERTLLLLMFRFLA